MMEKKMWKVSVRHHTNPWYIISLIKYIFWNFEVHRKGILEKVILKKKLKVDL